MGVSDLHVEKKPREVSLVFVAGFAALGGWLASTLDLVKVGGPLYDKAAGKDLIADILPPPECILELLRVAGNHPVVRPLSLATSR
jgi:hypothetical protein